jgi:2,4-dienoyl-CoA reductase-like NADH-dependent reductase (Old Yellow Enzyme family)/thioredoxin reductase
MSKLEHLLRPIRVKSLELRNRLVIPAMGTNLGNDDNTVSEAEIAFLRRRVQSGAGLVITGVTEVQLQGCHSPRSPGAWDDRFISGLRRLATAAHAEGARVGLQLHHAGGVSQWMLAQNKAVAPSAVSGYSLGHLPPPREMTLEEIEETIASFGSAAVRGREAGFDLVEIHGAHGYLLMQFLSAHTNRRTDGYGGDFRSRARFMIECIQEVRRRVGSDFPLSVRVSGEECVRGGYTIDDMVTVIPDVVLAGADLINVSFGGHADFQSSVDTPRPSAPVEYPQGFKVSLARRIKEVASVPVVTVGRFTDPLFMDRVIGSGDADLVAAGRQHLADPDFLRNYLEGHPEDTCECLACNQGCIERLAFERLSTRCSINPETGQELLYPSAPAAESKVVWIAGGGPAGLTAAWEAARLGHRVMLFEKKSETGGQITYARMAPYKGVYGKWIDTLLGKCRRKGVTIRTGTELTAELIEEGRPDRVIVATGAEPSPCSVAVSPSSMVCSAWQVLSGEVVPRDNALIIGGGLVGMETADFLLERGIGNLIIAEMLPQSPIPPMSSHGMMLHRRLQGRGIAVSLNTAVKTVESGYATLVTGGEERKVGPIEQVIVATGATPEEKLGPALQRMGIPYFVVGDARGTRRIIEATSEGAEAVWNI